MPQLSTSITIFLSVIFSLALLTTSRPLKQEKRTLHPLHSRTSSFFDESLLLLPEDFSSYSSPQQQQQASLLPGSYLLPSLDNNNIETLASLNLNNDNEALQITSSPSFAGSDPSTSAVNSGRGDGAPPCLAEIGGPGIYCNSDPQVSNRIGPNGELIDPSLPPETSSTTMTTTTTSTKGESGINSDGGGGDGGFFDFLRFPPRSR